MSIRIFVDVEAAGASPVNGTMTEFAAVTEARETFHGQLYESRPDPEVPAIPIPVRRLAADAEVATEFKAWLDGVAGGQRVVFVSDNPAYDFMWIACLFDNAGIDNPFGHTARRIGDFWAGLNNDWTQTQTWKDLRRTPHDHNPVNDCIGNIEAFEKLCEIAEQRRQGSTDSA
jgi:hypothetical protein